MKNRLVSMPFFVGDCLGPMSARLMTLAERGADVHLLCLNWQQGRLENDPEELARLLDCSLQRFHQIWKGISHKFKEDGQRRIYNPWVEAVKQQSLAGRKGGKATQAKRKRGSSQASSKNQPLIFSNPVQDSSSRNNKNTPLPSSSGGWLATKRLAVGGSTTVGANEGDQRKPVAIERQAWRSRRLRRRERPHQRVCRWRTGNAIMEGARR